MTTGEAVLRFTAFLDKLQSTISQVIDTVAGTSGQCTALAAQGSPYQRRHAVPSIRRWIWWRPRLKS